MATAQDSSNDDSADSGADDAQNQTPVNANELGTELSEEEEQAFINETLGIKSSDSKEDEGASKDDESEDDNSDDDKKGDEDSDDGEDTSDEVGEERESDGEAETGEESIDSESAGDKPAPKLDENGIKTDDLWVEVDKVSVDEDGKKISEKVKLVYDPQNPDSFLPDDFQFESDKQLFRVLEAKAEMANLYKERSTKAVADNEVKTAEQQKQAQLDSWDTEIQELIDGGILENPKAKPGDKNFLEDPQVQKIDSVFKFMTEQNQTRAKDGKAPILSFGTALNLFNKQQADKEAAEKKKTDNANAKKKGAMVGGSSAASGGSEKVYKAGSYGNIWEIPIGDD